MQEATITMYLRQRWNDPRLEYDEGPPYLRLFHWDSIWVPDTFFRHELYSYVHEQTVPNKLLRINGNGDIWYVMK